MKKVTIEQIGDGWEVTVEVGPDEPQEAVVTTTFTVFGESASSSKSLLGFVRDVFEQE